MERKCLHKTVHVQDDVNLHIFRIKGTPPPYNTIAGVHSINRVS